MVVEIGSCKHGIPAGTQCDDCNLAMLYQCPSCARFAAKMKDREGLAQVIHAQLPAAPGPSNHNTIMEGRRKIADAVIRWMEE